MSTTKNISDFEKLLNPNHYYIVVYNIDAYAEGYTGRNYNMYIHCSDYTPLNGWEKKKDLTNILSQVKKDNKTVKIPNSTIGQFNTIKVKTGKELIEDDKKDFVIRYTPYVRLAHDYSKKS